MDQSIYSRSVTILRRFASQSLNNFQVLYEPGFASPWDRLPITRYYGFVTDLRLKVDIKSLVEHPLPDLDLTQSRTERLTAVRDLEWGKDRYEFGMYLETSTAPLCKIASVSLLNRQPFYHVNLLPYFTDNGLINIASDARIMGRVEDAGFGLLSGADEVVVFGSVKEEVTTLPEDSREISFCQGSGFTLGTTATQLLPANANRLQATFVNTHNSNRIFLNYGTTATANTGITLMPNGGSYEINATNPYKGIISAVASGAGTTLTVQECV